MLADDPDDVAYLTGFFHHPGERPVAVLLPADGTARLLLPELEREHADRQQAAADWSSYPEFPGLRPPFGSPARCPAAADRLRRQHERGPAGT